MNKKMTLNDTIRESLAIALIQLMKTESISEITISEIVKVAGVGRSSFYRNFKNKEDLLCSYIIDLYNEYFDKKNVPLSMDKQTDMNEFLLPRFKFIKENRDIFRVLYDHNLLYYFFNQTENGLILVLCGQSENISSYYRAMFSGSCAGIVRHWIERDFADSEEDMVKLFMNPFQNIK